MSLEFLKSIADGSSFYVRPVGFVSGAVAEHAAAFPYRGSGRFFTGFVLYARTSSREVVSGYVGGHLLPELKNVLGSDAAESVDQQLNALALAHQSISLHNDAMLSFTRPLVMGVLNVTPDSFSDGGKFVDGESAVAHARQMMAAGADIIDIGGESTRPGATPVWEGEEAERVVPIIKALAGEGAIISTDTRNAFVMEKALEAGAHIINDVSALTHDPDSLAFAARANVPVVLMHAQGDPRTMQDDPIYDHVLLDVYDYLKGRVEACLQAGVARKNIIIDPGIGFGKRVVQDNLALINGLLMFQTLGCPVLLGASRKRFIGAISGVEQADERVAGSVASAVMGASLGADILRVHDVKETAEAMKMVQAGLDASAMDGLI